MRTRVPARWIRIPTRRTGLPAGRTRRIAAAATVIATLVLTTLTSLGSAASATPATPAASAADFRPTAVTAIGHVTWTNSCAAAAKPGFAACDAKRVTGGITEYLAEQAEGRVGTPRAAGPSSPSGFGPSDLRSAYGLTSAAVSSGAGQTIAVVDAYDDPHATSDLAAYRSHYGLPACTTASGCLKKVSQTGSTSALPSGDSGWAEEISLDLDMASAICPLCHLTLVEAKSAGYADLGAAVNEAVSLGAKYVSNSYGGDDSLTDSVYDTDYYKHAGVAITASSGDNGYGVEYPASSQYVTAVGGTTLARAASTTRGWRETAWSDAGSGCSLFEDKPSWQTDSGCSSRIVADVSAVADPKTGVSVYDSYGLTAGWYTFGGTSVAAPIIAGVYALAGPPSSGSYPAKFPYSHSSALNDVTSGSNGSCLVSYHCTAKPGYDGPTGLGTPAGTSAFAG